ARYRGRGIARWRGNRAVGDVRITQEDERDVVLCSLAYEVCDNFGATLGEVVTLCDTSEALCESLDARLDVLAATLDETVGVERQKVVLLQHHDRAGVALD